MWQELLTLWSSIRDPEYAYLLLESLPLYGLGAGLLFLLVSHLAGEKKSKLLALGLICTSCLSVWPAQDLRERAAPRVIATRDATLAPLIRTQTERRAKSAWAYLTLAVLSGVTLILQASGKGKMPLLLTALASIALFWFSIWLHKKECEVYHRNIVKYRPPR
ncbi:MAG: hypothetical protein KDK99_10125 [Verrucomicrobiales bacterium]|nr:hypothetical protein [Verrucomicrobiales bacterium]